MSDPRPTAWELLKQQRKFLVFMIVMTPIGFGIMLASIAIFVAMLRERISLELGLGLITGALTTGSLAAVAMGWKVVDGIVKEDVAKTEAQSPKPPIVGAIAAGEGARAASTQVAAANAEVPAATVPEPSSSALADSASSGPSSGTVTPVDNPSRKT